MTAPLSLGEVEAMALKAARGAGMPWGLAEEAAFAARWLAAQGVDGLGLLAQLFDRMPPETLGRAPVVSTGLWAALCPIATGAALNDHFTLPEGPMRAPVQLDTLTCPALVLPLLAAAAARCDAVVIVAWQECQAVLAQGTLMAVIGAGLMADHAARVTISAARTWPLGTSPAEPAAQTRQRLEALIARTYVPASDQSRRGAGAADSDTA